MDLRLPPKIKGTLKNWTHYFKHKNPEINFITMKTKDVRSPLPSVFLIPLFKQKQDVLFYVCSSNVRFEVHKRIVFQSAYTVHITW
jgi:hypothetical protein